MYIIINKCKAGCTVRHLWSCLLEIGPGQEPDLLWLKTAPIGALADQVVGTKPVIRVPLTVEKKSETKDGDHSSWS